MIWRLAQRLGTLTARRALMPRKALCRKERLESMPEQTHSISYLLRGLSLALVLVLTPEALADRIILRTGEVLVGEVVDSGDEVQLKQALGAVTISKDRIDRIEYDAPPPGPDGRPLDIVIQTGGRILRGRARVSADNSYVTVTISGQEVSIPKDHVREILWEGRREREEGKTKAEIDSRIAELVKILTQVPVTEGDNLTHKTARQELLDLGVFALPVINELLEKTADGDPTKRVFQEIKARHSLKAVVTAEIENKVKDCHLRLSSTSPETRRSVLDDIVIEAPDSAPKLMLHVVKTDKDPDVRASAMSHLSMLRAFPQLVEILRIPEGRLRLAAAIALGEQGVLAGVPILIDTLNLNEESYERVLKSESESEEAKAKARAEILLLKQLQTLADSKLKEFTGQDFGFNVTKSQEDRAKAIRNWKTWWDKNGERLMEQSVKVVQGEVKDSKERRAAEQVWIRGNELLLLYERLVDEGGRSALEGIERRAKFREVAALFQEAINIDPTFVKARLALAYVFYNELERNDDARAQLKAVLNQIHGVESNLPRIRAYLHLAMLSQREGDMRDAELRLFDGLKLSSSEALEDSIDLRLDLHLALGNLYLDWALVRDRLGLDSATLPSGTGAPGEAPKPGAPGPSAEEARAAATKREAEFQAQVEVRLKAAQTAFERGLSEIYQQDVRFRAEIQKHLAVSDQDPRKANVLTSLRNSIALLKFRSASFYYGLGRACAGLKLPQSAAKHFETASKLDPSNKGYESAAKFWREALTDGESKKD